MIAIAGAAFSITLCAIGLSFYLTGLFLELAFDKSYPHPRFPSGKFLFPLLLSLMISLLISRYFNVSLRGSWKFMEGFIFLYAAVDVIRTAEEARMVIFTLISVYSFSVLAGLSQDVIGFDFVYHRAAIYTTSELPKRITGAFKHYNDYGSFLVPGFAVIFALMFNSFSNKRILSGFLYSSLLILLGYVLIRTLSRSAILSVFISLFFFCIFFRFRWFAISGLILMILLAWLIPSPLSTRLKDLFSSSTPERILLVKTSLSMIKSKPLFGFGINTYSEYFPKFRPVGYRGLMYAHNSYLQMAVEIGLVGVFFYLLFLAALFLGTLKTVFSSTLSEHRTLTIGVLSSVLGLLINALFESLLQSTQLRTLFWILIGIFTALSTNLLSHENHRS